MAATGKIDELRRVSLFAGCTRVELARVASLVDEAEVAAGRVLIREGDLAQECFVIAEGRARVHLGGQTLAHLGPGDIVGELALLDAGPRSATVEAETAMRLYVLDPRRFATLLEDLPSFRRSVTRTLGRRLRRADALATG